MTTFGFEVASHLAASAEVVWAHATRMDGVNRELWPLVRMTHPRGTAMLEADHVALGRPVFRSWILLFGFLPIDYDDLTLVAIEPGRFLERSPMLSQELWCHERRVEPVASGGCRVEDRITFTPRLALLGRLQLPLFRLAFRLRHRNLRRLFGAVP